MFTLLLSINQYVCRAAVVTVRVQIATLLVCPNHINAYNYVDLLGSCACVRVLYQIQDRTGVVSLS